MEKKRMATGTLAGILIVAGLVIGQVIAYLVAPNSWQAFVGRLPVVISMIGFWGPIIALFAGLFVWLMLNLLGFETLEEIREESVNENNPTPAIIFVGTLIAALLFLMLIIRP